MASRISDEQLRILEGFYQKGISIKVDREQRGRLQDLTWSATAIFHLSFFLFWGNKRLTEIYRHLNAHMQIARLIA